MYKSVVFMFSGQGSQYYQMGKEFFENNTVYRKSMFELDDIAKGLIGKSVLDKLYDKNRSSEEPFDNLIFTHPALFMTQYSYSKVLISNGFNPDYVLGTSLGEFVAAAVSQVISLEDALESVIAHASVIENNVSDDGGMIAILDKISSYEQSSFFKDDCELAGVNFDSHFVLSGEMKTIVEIEKYLKANHIGCQVLPVKYGFHSSHIKAAEQKYKSYLETKKYCKPKIQYVSSVYGGILESFPRHYFWEVASKPMIFQTAMRKLEDISTNLYVDVGPTGTLANFAKYNINPKSASSYISMMNPFKQVFKSYEEAYGILVKNKEKKMENKTIVHAFPGQGSQFRGMGESLFDEFKELTEKADRILSYSIRELCIQDPKEVLSLTQYTQPALFVVNALSYLKKIKETGRKPDYLIGHSLGEYNALFAAGVFDFETGLKLVKKRGELMGDAHGGGMAAVIGFDEEKVREVLQKYNLTTIEIANINTTTQTIISGIKIDVERASEYFEKEGARKYVLIKVSGAFHSRYMKQAEEKFYEYMSQFNFVSPQIPVISNYSARKYNPKYLKETLKKQISNPVQWLESIRYLMSKNQVEFVQIGPGDVVYSLIREVQRKSTPLFVEEEPMDNTPVDGSNVDFNDNKKEISKNILLVTPFSLGSQEFKKDYNLKYAYLTGGMYRGIASKEMVVKMGQVGMMGFLGSGGMDLERLEDEIKFIKDKLEDKPYGINFLNDPNNSQKQDKTITLLLKHQVRSIEAAAFMNITLPLVYYRLSGIKISKDGSPICENKILAKISRPEVAEGFLSPPPPQLVDKLLREGKITQIQADIARIIPMADDICVESDSGGHTDQGVALALFPAILTLRDEMMKRYQYGRKIRVGAAGGIGTPEAAMAVFMLGADFIMTGSINQCTVEAVTSDLVKDMLQVINVQDTEYAPAGDMFELGARVQVLRRGVFFPARANRLYELYKNHESLDEIDESVRMQIENKYFKKTFDEVYEIVKKYYPREQIERAERNGKHKMALIFRWYFGYATNAAINGEEEHRVNFQVHTGPALGAFNQWVKGSKFEDWRNRQVDEIGIMLMEKTAELLNEKIRELVNKNNKIFV